ncbi:MAG TPA: hypothetical protein VI410_08480 [Anaerolineales bacterium]|nr:hypothetical protein [Anaerolineales bacterium]
MEGSASTTSVRDGPLGSLTRSLGALRPAHISLRKCAITAGLLAVCLGFLAAVQFSTPSLVGNDGYYHIRLAELMREDGLKPEFVWLPLTILSPEQFVDHHFLFHVLLIPFSFGDLIVGAKWASVVFAASAFAALGWLLHRQKVPYAPLWTIAGLVVSEAFIYRMSMARAQSLSLTVLILALGWLLSGHFRRLLPLGFLYVWLYDAFPLLLVVCACYVAAGWLLDRRLRLAPLGYAGAGIGLGLLINPYFPENLLFIGRHLLPKLTEATSISVGNEWFPYDTAQLVGNSGLALLALASGALALGLQGRRMGVGPATALFFGLVLGLMLFQARRFVEYFPPFGLIFAAMAWSPLLRRAGLAGAGDRADSETGALDHQSPLSWRKIGIAAIAVGALAAGLWANLEASQVSVRASRSAQRLQAAASWLEGHSPEGARVFQTDWDDFPRLFFYNSHNTYTVGLDPTYLQLQDAGLYDLWVDLTQGRAEDLSASIRESFGAEYALSDLDHQRFLEAVAEDPQMRELYRDEFAVVFAVEAEPAP